jgi:hypothetical protein
MEDITLSTIAIVAGFAVPAAMLLKHLAALGRAYHDSRQPDAEFLELFVNGKDYSVDLRTMNNGGSERIHEARRELERCA